MDGHGARLLARRAARAYIMVDLVIGPTLVGAAFLGFVVWVLAVAASWRLGVPWPVAMTAVGVSWVGIALSARRALLWESRWLVRRA